MDKSLIVNRSGCDPAAIAAREAQINGAPQRIEPVNPLEVSGDSLELINSIRASVGAAAVRAADIPEYMLTMLKHPDIFRCQMEMGTALFKGKIPARERELAVLRVAWLMRAPYEWGQHVNIAKRYGAASEEIERVIAGADAPGWSKHEAALLRAVDELLSDQAISDETWGALAKSWDEGQLLEFPMIVGQYIATALVQNALRIRLERGNPGLTLR